MISGDPRCYPLIELSRQQVRAMLQPVLGDAELREVLRVDGGLVNTIYRIRTKGASVTYALRVYAAERTAYEKECQLLCTLARTLPVPRVLFADTSCRHCAYPYLIYQWIEGISLNECRRQISQAAFLTLAEPMGRTLAQIAGTGFPAEHSSKTIRVTTMLERATEQLRTGSARERMGGALADSLRECLYKSSSLLQEPDDTSVLVHGDFGGRNILVQKTESGQWEISGVIDWEEAAVGSALWDVGSLFRYTRRYSEEFRARFAGGYIAAGGLLPTDWHLAARAIDATRLVSILSEERELPSVFAECVELIESLVTEMRPTAA